MTLKPTEVVAAVVAVAQEYGLGSVCVKQRPMHSFLSCFHNHCRVPFKGNVIRGMTTTTTTVKPNIFNSKDINQFGKS